ncbi:hypothetical protein IW262DRAFT_1452673 [Armillaria fumosa]|nr:hypothetical protein IW262DRAFT_1452673 [Armillaria fumosa]
MQPVPAGYPIEKLSGPLIVAYLLHWGLFGTLTVQLYLYYLAFPNDRRFTKYLVYGIYAIEFVQTMLITHEAFTEFGYGFGDMETLTGMYYNWLTVPVMSAVVAFVGQVFYAYRIYVLSASRAVPVFITCVALSSSVAAVVTGVYCYQAGDVTKLSTDWETSIAIGFWCGGSALCDIIIAVCMAFYLTRYDTGFRRTRMLVTKLIRLTIETGSVTAAVALLNLILFFAFPHQTFYVTAALIIPKLYANTVYMVLNSRIQIIGGRDTYRSATDMNVTTSVIHHLNDRNFQFTSDTERVVQQPPGPVVTITKEVLSDGYEMSPTNNKPRDGDIGYTV